MNTPNRVVERLLEEAERLSGHSIDRGSVDAGIASNLASEAAAEIERLEADNAQMQELMLLADRFFLGTDWEGTNIWVVSRGPSQWAVWDGAFVLANSGKWEREPMPSSRSDEFIARTRFTFAEAVTRARTALRTLTEPKP